MKKQQLSLFQKEHRGCRKPGRDVLNPRFSPAVELNPISQFGELVRKAPLLYDSLWTDGHLAQGVGFWGGQEAELIDAVSHHILGGRVLADDDVTALLVGFEHPDDLVWDV